MIQKIGIILDVPNTNFLAILLKKEGVEKVTGKSLEQIFSECPKNKSYKTKNGLILDIDLYQQFALLKAINNTNPKLNLGFFNAPALQNVRDALYDSNVHMRLGVHWFWGGDNFFEIRLKKPDQPSLISADKISFKKDEPYINIQIHYGIPSAMTPDYHDDQGGVVFGIEKGK
jgi:hypothetical protein